MKFGPVSLDQAEGKILGHNVVRPDGRRLLRKGTVLDADAIQGLRKLGRRSVYVAELEPDDVDENRAAEAIALALMGDGLRLSGPSTGRANLYTTILGLLRVDVDCLAAMNRCPGVTLATLPTNTPVTDGKMVATLKIMPYAIPRQTVDEAVRLAAGNRLLRIDRLASRRVGLILSGSPYARERLERSFQGALRGRLEALGSAISRVDFVPLDDEADEAALAKMLDEHTSAGMEMIILAGGTAIMDRADIAPRAVERAGGEITCYGAPVDPGNLMMLAYLDETPILGAPGCARSPKANIVDLVLPRLLAGDRLTAEDIIALGHGGLLEDVPERPSPRSRLE